jgi:hypothetical protein
MVYCIKCGAENVDNAKYCYKCGTNLEISPEKGFEKRVEKWGEEFGRRAEEWGEDLGRRVEEDCFGLPHGGSIAGIIFGIFILIIGLGILFDWSVNIGGYVIVFIGVLILASAIYGLSRRGIK